MPLIVTPVSCKGAFQTHIHLLLLVVNPTSFPWIGQTSLVHSLCCASPQLAGLAWLERSTPSHSGDHQGPETWDSNRKIRVECGAFHKEEDASIHQALQPSPYHDNEKMGMNLYTRRYILVLSEGCHSEHLFAFVRICSHYSLISQPNIKMFSFQTTSIWPSTFRTPAPFFRLRILFGW